MAVRDGFSFSFMDLRWDVGEIFGFEIFLDVSF